MTITRAFRLAVLLAVTCGPALAQRNVSAEVNATQFFLNKPIGVVYTHSDSTRSFKRITFDHAPFFTVTREGLKDSIFAVSSSSGTAINTNGLKRVVTYTNSRTLNLIPKHSGKLQLPMGYFHYDDTVVAVNPGIIHVEDKPMSMDDSVTWRYGDARFVDLIVVRKPGNQLHLVSESLPDQLMLGRDTLRIKFTIVLDTFTYSGYRGKHMKVFRELGVAESQRRWFPKISYAERFREGPAVVLKPHGIGLEMLQGVDQYNTYCLVPTRAGRRSVNLGVIQNGQEKISLGKITLKVRKS